MKKRAWLIAGGAVAFLGSAAAAYAGPDNVRWTLGGRVETPKYRVVSTKGAFEVRLYEPMVVAETEVDGTMAQSGNAGFRRLGGYIFGGNAQQQSIAMTAPVAMQPTQDGRWRVTFMMPSQHDLADLPVPKDATVRLTPVAQSHMAAITLRGTWSPEEFTAKAKALESQVRAAGMEPAGAPIFARYDPPWTPPFLRRNEILVPVRFSN